MKACTAKVNRQEEDEIKAGTQELACKIYKKKQLKNKKFGKSDPLTG